MLGRNKKQILLYSLIIVFAVVFFLGLASAVNCWQYTSSSTCTNGNGCNWRNDSWNTNGWCEELSCWNLFTQNSCTTTSIAGKNCTWQGGGTTYNCERLSCWSLAGTNANSCINNTKGLSCDWSDSCYSSGSGAANCMQYQSQSACTNATGCSWGQCNDKGCRGYSTNTTCNAAKDWNGKNCTWNSNSNSCEQNGCWKYNTNSSYCTNNPAGLGCQWKWNSCQDLSCYSWDFTNATACINNTANLSCSWSGSYCNSKDCWSYTTNATCAQQPNCLWKGYTSSGMCEEVQCWSWDSTRGGNRTLCESNSYGLSCKWSGNPAGNNTNGWCYKDTASVSCSNYTSERACMDTFYCWWQFVDWNNPSGGGTCNTPGTIGTGGGNITSILNDWNPGCYIFDMNSTDCNNVLGCNYTNGQCASLGNSYGGNITLNGLNCTYINSSNLCNSIPILSSCCSWQNGTCTTNQLSSSCRDQMQAPPAGASFCEDYSAYGNQQVCEQIAGSPWYMPCKWENATSTCKFKASDVFGNESQSLTKLDNKKSCEAAGGKWVTENYCEGNISIPTGRCEYKFNEETNCDKACFACEIKDSNGNSVNSTNAASACIGSRLGICDFSANTNAPNGIGYCKAKEQFKKGTANDCDSNCGDCTFKGDPLNNETTKRPSYHCAISKANSVGGGCKWINDNSTATGGYCINKGDKTCQDSCDRCNTQTDCSNLGRTSITNQTGSCKWQGSTTSGSCVANIAGDVEICWDGVDNNGNNLIDCSDSSCFGDTSCGFVSGDCFGWANNNTCIEKGCEWVTDNWGSFCDFKGSQCWKNNDNENSCAGIVSRNETLNISSARLAGNNINETKTFTLTNIGTGWVLNSVIIKNASGTSLAGNYTVNYTTQRITFLNNTFMVAGGGAENITNVSYSYYSRVQNCQWNNGSGGASSSWCEQDWSRQETCMGLNRNSCMALNASGCNWTIDTWCSGTGNGTSWCNSGGGWCDNLNFMPKNCWQQSSSSGCNAATGCNWRTDQYSQSRCEVNWSSNCGQYSSNGTCSVNSNCIWDTPPQGGGWCTNKFDKCWSYNETTCNGALSGRCSWQSWGGGGGSCQAACWNSSASSEAGCTAITGCSWKAEAGWCEDSSPCTNSTNMNTQNNCQATSGCRWKSSGWCDPKGGSFNTGSIVGGGGVGSGMGGNCFKYDGNQTLCTNQTIINMSCGWTTNPSPKCEPNWGSDCWRYSSVGGGCNATNGCWFKNDSFGSFCTNLVDQCWQNMSLTSNLTLCSQSPYCTNTSFGGCEPKCFSQDSSSCNATFCKWTNGWCNAGGMTEMFDDMESGAPVMLGKDVCPETGKQASVDLCGFGMKDMGDSYGFGSNVYDFTNASVCNKERLSSFVMGQIGGGPPGMGGGQERIGAGNDTVIYFVYLDTDGATTGGCSLDHNTSAAGYEFRFKYTSEWNANTSKAAETFNSYTCEDGDWRASDVKISAWKKIMCSDIGGPMIAVKKSDLSKHPSLYSSTADMRVYVTTIGNTGNVTSPTDTAGPGWTTPGAVDFEVKSAFDYGANSAKFEDILKKGFLQGEDCFTSADDDADGDTNCNDWDCQYSSVCSGTGVNAAGYIDTSTPLVTGVKIEEYPDSALIMYDTNKPANGTVEFYGTDSQCLTLNASVYDIGITSTYVRDYKLWHTGEIYSAKIGYNLASSTSYYYKLKVCDSNNKCAISKCTSFRTPVSEQKCGFCDFVTRIKTPTNWKVSYDVNKDGTYEHVQGEVCGPNAGMKTNYTAGRGVNIKLYKSDGSMYIEFLNSSLTKTGLNDKVRTISTSGDIIGTSTLVGLTSETRDKIVNNLHPEICRVKIPNSGTCTQLWHCDDNGANCVDKTSVSTLVDSANCVWQVPYCEFSTYKTNDASGGTNSPGGGGGSGGGGATTNGTRNQTTPPVTGGVVSGGEDQEGEEPQQSPPFGGSGEETEQGGGKSNGWIMFVVLGVIAVIVVVVIAGLKFRKR